MFAILVLMALFTTFLTTPAVMAIYKPARDPIKNPKWNLRPDHNQDWLTTMTNSKDSFRVLACAHGPSNVPGLINLIDSARGTATSSRQLMIKAYVMHLIELTERSSSIVMVQRLRRNGLPFINSSSRRGSMEVHGRVASAFQFQSYAQLGRVKVRPITTISPLGTIHEDICHVAEEKRVVMIILPFHKLSRKSEDDDGELKVESMGYGWRGVSQRVLKAAPCSVAILVDRGLGVEKSSGSVQRVCVVFFGGPDDREALELGGRMADHPTLKVTLIRFKEKDGMNDNVVKLMPSPEKCNETNYTFSIATMNRDEEMALDDSAVAEYRTKWDKTTEYMEREIMNIEEEVLLAGRSGNYELIIVGKGRFPSTMVAKLADRQAEHAELGPIGDILSSSNSGVVSSVLVVQKHDLAHIEEVPVHKVVHTSDGDHEICNEV